MSCYRTVELSTIAAGLNLSPCRRHTHTRQLALKKQKRDSFENTTLCHSVVHIVLDRQHCRRLCLWCGVNCSFLNRRHECRSQATNGRKMILVDMATSRVYLTSWKMEEKVAWRFFPLVGGCVDSHMLTSLWLNGNPQTCYISLFQPSAPQPVHSGSIQVCQLRFAVWINLSFSVQLPCPS